MAPEEGLEAMASSLVTAFADGSEEQRVQALRKAREGGFALPIEPVMDALRNDPSPRIRAEALEFLAASPETSGAQMDEAVAVAESDSDPALQGRARELHASLDEFKRNDAEARALLNQ